MKRRTNYQLHLIPRPAGFTVDVVVLVDRSTHDPRAVSITNAAEQVVEEVWDVWKERARCILYTDTDHYLDELVHEEGVFRGFAPLINPSDALTDTLKAVGIDFKPRRMRT